MPYPRRKKRTKDSPLGLITGPLKIGYGLARLITDNVPSPQRKTVVAPQSTPRSSTRVLAPRLTKQQRIARSLAEWTEEDERLAAIYPRTVFRPPSALSRLLRVGARTLLFVLLLPVWFAWEGLRFFASAALWFTKRLWVTLRRAKLPPVAPEPSGDLTAPPDDQS